MVCYGVGDLVVVRCRLVRVQSWLEGMVGEGRGGERGEEPYDGSVVVHFVEEVAKAGVFFCGDAGVGGGGYGVGIGG